VIARPRLSELQVLLIVVFTIVEFLTLQVWLYLLAPSLFTSTYVVVSGILLFAGLLAEHTIAVIAGDFPAEGAVQPQRPFESPISLLMVDRPEVYMRPFEARRDTGESGETYDAEAASAKTETSTQV
jgi:hypothetical protein